MAIQNDDDTLLMMRVKRGDRDAFAQLVDRHKSTVINIIYRAIGDAWEAEDLAQRVFVQMYRAAGRYKPKAKFTTWMYRVVHNAIVNEYRRRSRHRLDSINSMENPDREDAVGHQLEDGQVVGPDEQAAHRELLQQLQRAVQQLPEKQRMAIVLCRYEGQTYEEIGRILKVSVPAVKSLLHRARITLKNDLKRFI